MKKLLFVLMTGLAFCACRKKTETPIFSTLIVGKWGCDSYKKDGSDTIAHLQPYSLTGRYEQGWDFLTNKKIRYKHVNSWDEKPEDDDYYELLEDKTLVLTQISGSQSSTFKFNIMELSDRKLTIYSKGSGATFFLVRE